MVSSGVIVAVQLPDFGVVAFTLGEERRSALTLSERATQLGGAWTPLLVERAR